MIDSRDGPGSEQVAHPVASRCRVLVVDDSRLYREGLVQLLAAHLGRDAVVAADPLAEVQVRMAVDEPEVIIVNLTSRRSEEILTAIAGRHPQAHVIVVGVDDADEGQVLGCAEAGVRGYVSRENSLADLLEVIDEVSAGGSHVSQRISSLLLRRVREVAERRPGPPRLSALTDREIQILRLLGGGLSNQGIADELTIELYTVKNHVHSLLTKLGVRRRGEAAALLTGWDPLGRESAGSGAVVFPTPRMDPRTDQRVQAPDRGRGAP